LKDPEEKEDWQLAVNLAQALILIDVSKQCGGRMGIDPKCDVRRCEDILIRGKSMGFEPSLREVDTIIQALAKAPD
jgi:hypothetical protein